MLRYRPESREWLQVQWLSMVQQKLNHLLQQASSTHQALTVKVLVLSFPLQHNAAVCTA